MDKKKCTFFRVKSLKYAYTNKNTPFRSYVRENTISKYLHEQIK